MLVSAASADTFIVIDYKYDTNNFFDTDQKKAALEAAAVRWSNIINSPLTAVGPGGTATGTPAGWRIGFSHPGTGLDFELSTAANSASDPIITAGGKAAGEYGFGGLAANQWILYAGGRNLSSAGVGGTGTGINFTSTFDDLQGPMHRGVFSNTPANSVADLPAWGGSISFDNSGAIPWHFDPTTAAPSGTVDLYTIALHEIGHALGLSADLFNQWANFESGTQFTGPNAVAALNADNGTSATFVSMVDAANAHWADQGHQSKIFSLGDPNYVGTVGAVNPENLQDLLMDPTANFSDTVRRLEITNVDVGALRDLGWSVIVAPVPEPGSLLVLGGAALGAAGCRWRQRRRAAG